MASIYDFDAAFQNYRNKQRLKGGQLDPRMVSALAEADLNARYNDQKSRRALDLQEKSINNSYDLATKGMAQNASQFAQNMKAQKSTGNINSALAMAGLIPSFAGAGKSLGLWGQEQPDELKSAYTNYLRSITKTPESPQVTPSMYNNLTGGDVPNQTPADWSMVSDVPTGMPEFSTWFQPDMPTNFVEPTDIGYMPEDTSWMKFFEGWF